MYAKKIRAGVVVTLLFLSSVVDTALAGPQDRELYPAAPGFTFFSYVRHILLPRVTVSGAIENKLQAARAQEIVDTLHEFYGIEIEVDWGWSPKSLLDRSLVWNRGKMGS